MGTSGPSPSYLLRHWRGDLPLPVSYWANGILVSLLMSGVGVVLSFIVDFPSAPRFWAAAMIAVWLFAIVATIWQVVGVWRSAGKHASRGGAKGWALAARAAIVVGCVQVGALVVTRAPAELWEFAVMLADRDPNHGSEVRLLRAGSEMEVSGYIAFGLSDRVKAELDAHPGVNIIHLNSNGGRVAEARRLRDLIAFRHLSTYTSSRCLSACVIPFLAGERRLVSPGARIGFHQYTVGGKAGAYTLADMEKEKGYFMSRGVSSAFVMHAFRPSNIMWYPTHEEMLDAGYITGYADSGEVALSGVEPGDLDKVEQTLRDDPLYGAIAEADPPAYQAIAAAVKDGFRRGQSMADLQARMRPVIEQVYRKRLPFASDDAIIEFARLMVDKIAVLRADPDSCVAYIAPGSHPGADLRALFGSDLLHREQAVMTDVIRSAASGAWQPPAEADLRPIRAEVSARLLVTWSAEDLDQLAHLDRPGADPARVCDVCYGFYKVIVDLPAEKAGPMLRYTFAGAAR